MICDHHISNIWSQAFSDVTCCLCFREAQKDQSQLVAALTYKNKILTNERNELQHQVRELINGRYSVIVSDIPLLCSLFIQSLPFSLSLPLSLLVSPSLCTPFFSHHRPLHIQTRVIHTPTCAAAAHYFTDLVCVFFTLCLLTYCTAVPVCFSLPSLHFVILWLADIVFSTYQTTSRKSGTIDRVMRYFLFRLDGVC